MKIHNLLSNCPPSCQSFLNGSCQHIRTYNGLRHTCIHKQKLMLIIYGVWRMPHDHSFLEPSKIEYSPRVVIPFPSSHPHSSSDFLFQRGFSWHSRTCEQYSLFGFTVPASMSLLRMTTLWSKYVSGICWCWRSVVTTFSCDWNYRFSLDAITNSWNSNFKIICNI